MPQITETEQNIVALSDSKNKKEKSKFQQDFEKGIPLEVARQRLLKKVKELWSK